MTKTLASRFVRLPWRQGAWDRLMLQWHAPDRSDWGLVRHGILRERHWHLGPVTLTWWRLATNDEIPPVSAEAGDTDGD
jgi:hypothetical protein